MRKRIKHVAVAAAVTAAGISAAPPAEASTVWDRVARCESGGRWHLNTGNGFYGGLQIARRTWAGNGGRRYATRPDTASKSAQIKVARRILATQGPRAWPVCGRRAGLR